MLSFTQFSPFIFGLLMGFTIMFWCWFADEKELDDAKSKNANGSRLGISGILFFITLIVFVTSDYMADL